MLSWLRPSRFHVVTLALVSAGLAVTLLGVARDGATVAHAAAAALPCGKNTAARISQPSAARMKAAGLSTFPVAPASKRVDLVAPPFSRSTNVTNPLFPISKLHSVVLNGRVDGKAFRTETTLLPETRIIEWSKGRCVKTLVSQYFAYLDGRIEEVALDFYAQADDGSVWYFGEEVYNYKRGVLAHTSGTWLAGKEGPAAMIMPAAPKVGNVHRPENIPGLVWEEVAVKGIGKTVDGPRGKIGGVLVARELHDDGSFSDKVFAPGYGEFFSGHDGDVEALAVAVPTDAARSPVPRELLSLSSGANVVFGAAAERRWEAASKTVDTIASAWKAHREGDVPPRLVGPMSRALAVLDQAVEARAAGRARHAALDVVQAGLDLQLRYRSPGAIDRARFDLWARQVLVDARSRNLAALSGDAATLEWIRDRIAHTLDDVSVTRLDTRLEELRANVNDGEPAAAAATAQALRKVLAAARIVR